MKPVLVMALLYIASVSAIYVAYTPNDFEVSLLEFQVVLDVLPVFRLALWLTLLCPVCLLLAFWLSRGEQKDFEQLALIFAFLAPGAAMLLILPSGDALRGMVRLRGVGFGFVIWVSQMLATVALRSWFWERGATQRD